MAEVLLIGGRSGAGKTTVGWEVAAVWANYAALGCTRLVYVNTLSVLPSYHRMFRRALGDDVRLTPVLLTASDTTVAARLTRRELGSELADGLATSAERDRVLARLTDVVRVATDGRAVVDVALEVVAASGWAS